MVIRRLDGRAECLNEAGRSILSRQIAVVHVVSSGWNLWPVYFGTREERVLGSVIEVSELYKTHYD